MAPTETNTWYIEFLGTDAGIRFSTKEPKTLWRYQRFADQGWFRSISDLSPLSPTITGAIFENRFQRLFQQMWAAFLAEHVISLGDTIRLRDADERLSTSSIQTIAKKSSEGDPV